VTLALIPARGGSKRIPRKNIRPFLGVPMLARTITLLQEAAVFDRVVVSTDDTEVAEVARRAGAEVPFARPEELANDLAATLPVIEHGIRTLEVAGFVADYVCCVYPASVLSRPDDFREALRMLRESDADYVFSATTFPYPIQRALRMTANGGCEMFWPEHRATRSQDLEAAFHDAGQFYWGRRDAWLEGRPIFSERSRLLLLPRYRVQDIDTLEDWERAERIYDANQSTPKV
jgi:pseudaminic acid cytidylyltransferase